MAVKRSIFILTENIIFSDRIPISVTRVEENFTSLEHCHDFIEVCYVEEGAGTHHIGNTSVAAAKGDLFFIPVGVPHVFRPHSTSRRTPLIVYNCMFSPERMAMLARAIPGGEAMLDLLAQDQWQHFYDRYGDCHNRFLQLHLEYASVQPGREMALYVHVLELLLLIRRLATESPNPRLPQPPELESALHWLHSCYNQPFLLGDLAAMAGVGERQFHRLFTKYTGMPMKEYLQNIRITEACRLLTTTSQKIGDIAAAVGYQDTAYFNRLFKKKTGVSPRLYRQSVI